MKKKETLHGPEGLRIVLDATEIFPDDPGNGTPAMVVAPFGGGTATFWCAASEGELDGRHILTTAQITWLNASEDVVNQWVEIRSAALRRDGRKALEAME